MKIKTEKFSDRLTKWVGSTSSLVLHTLLFIAVFIAGLLGVDWDTLLLVLTTAVSLEAIYLAIFIQMSVNRTAQDLQSVGADIDEIQEDVDEIQEDVEEIQADIDEIQEDVDEIQEDVEEIQADDEEDKMIDDEQIKTMRHIKEEIANLMASIESLNKINNKKRIDKKVDLKKK